MRESVEHGHISGRQVEKGAITNFRAEDYARLGQIGVQIPVPQLQAMMEGIGMDALTPSLTTASIPTPVEFLRTWLPGFVKIITAARKIDELIGVTTAGSWEDEEIVLGVIEELGTVVPYSDYGNVPLSNWNLNYDTRTIVRFEEGMRVGILEEARSAKVRVNTAEMKRSAASLALEIQRNNVGFNGYNAGDNKTYGFLNEPGLPNYVVFPNGATSASPLWSSKTFVDITKDIQTMVQAIRTAMQGNFSSSTPLTLAIPESVVDYLSTVNTLGSQSVRQWLTMTYSQIRVVSAPELNTAHSGGTATYLYVDSVSDTSTDDGRIWVQIVPSKFRVLGVQTLVKGYEEDYSNACAGVFLKRPYAVVRYYGN